MQSQSNRENNNRIYKWFKDDNVIVFPRNALSPWDDILRFNFMDYNLANLGTDSLGHTSEKLRSKDTFVG